MQGYTYFSKILSLLQNKDCGYALEPPHSRVSTIRVLSKNKKNGKSFISRIFNFYNFRKIFILHGCVFVMLYFVDVSRMVPVCL